MILRETDNPYIYKNEYEFQVRLSATVQKSKTNYIILNC